MKRIFEADGCPTCSHTLGTLCVHEGMQFVNCDRCGTVVVRILEGDYPDRVYVPKLVERCREFEKTLPLEGMPSTLTRETWHRLGIAEAIRRPEDRK